MRPVALLDIGNTRTRIVIVDGDAWSELRALPTAELDPARLPAGVPMAACCVVPGAAARLAGCGVRFLTADAVPQALLKLDRIDSSTLGADRLANAIEAAATVSGAVAVFDCGTAITVEVVDAAKAFRGGAILPGRVLQRQALHRGTAQLPELPPAATARREAGTDTAESIAFGVDRGTVGAVRELAAELRRQWGGALRLLATGGDARFFLAELPELEEAGENFTLRGLYRWLCAVDGR